MKLAFKNVKAYTETGFTTRSIVFDDRILDICDDADGATEIPLPKNAAVLPGFIDAHIHGAGGADTMDATPDALATISKTLAAEGTTAFLATTMTCPHDRILAALTAVKRYREQNETAGARCIGVHLEGPFISEKYKGAQSEKYIAPPSVQKLDEYNAACGNCIKKVTLAPEKQNADALIRAVVNSGAVASIGHSAATHADVVQAVLGGARSVTHTFNAQTPIGHREIGVAGSALLMNELVCELICDCIHVSVPAMQLLVNNKPKNKLMLITDAIRAKGLGDGQSELGGQTVTVENGEARLADGTLAGSVLKMNVAVKNLHEKVGVPLEQAIDCATIVPAASLGIAGSCGSVAVGKRADFAVVDDKLNIIMTFVGGKIVYKA